MTMRDIDVRTVLAAEVQKHFQGTSDTLIIHELGLWSGIVRVDLAVINGRLHGFEIKSDSDTLKRLPSQADVYNAVFDQMTLVVGAHHLQAARAIVPEWWGIVRADPGTPVSLTEIRVPQPNPSPDPIAIARLLWRDEAVTLLETSGTAKGVKSKSRELVYRRLVEAFPLDELRYAVREQLKAREGWRSDAQRT